MLKLASRMYLLANVFAIVLLCILHEQFSLSIVRLISCVWFSSFFSIPGIIIFNGLLRLVRSLKLQLLWSWILLLISVLFISHFVTSLLAVLGFVGFDTIELVWLVVNTSSCLALLIQFPAITLLLKSRNEKKPLYATR